MICFPAQKSGKPGQPLMYGNTLTRRGNVSCMPQQESATGLLPLLLLARGSHRRLVSCLPGKLMPVSREQDTKTLKADA